MSQNLVYGNGRDYDLAAPSRATAEAGTIHAGPQFVLYRADGGGDYHVKSTSPAVGRGGPEYAPAVDIEGKPRGASVTMGAYQ